MVIIIAILLINNNIFYLYLQPVVNSGNRLSVTCSGNTSTITISREENNNQDANVQVDYYCYHSRNYSEIKRYTVTHSSCMVDDLNCRAVLIPNLQNSISNGYQKSVNVTENSTCIFVGCVENKEWRDWYFIIGNGSKCTNGNAIYYFIKFLLCFYPCTLYFR